MIKLKYKVKRLKEGSVIGVVSPSWSGPASFPHVYEKGLENLKKYFGFKIKEFSNTRMQYDGSLDYVKKRVKDIHDAFFDDSVDAIFLSIGGDDAIRLLPYLDKKIIEAHPKIVMGFSDSTNILIYLVKLGIPAFHGPSIMAGFAEPEGLSEEFVNHFRTFYFDNWKTYTYPRYKNWTEDRGGWSDPDFLNRKKIYKENTAVHILGGNIKSEGILIGGCIEIIEMLKGTEFGLTKSDFENSAFFLETSEDKPSPDYVKCALRSYGVAGAFNGIQSILIGKSRGYTDDEYKKLEEYISTVIQKEFNNSRISIISNFDIGHTQPIWILPIGIKTRIDSENKTIELVESPFK